MVITNIVHKSTTQWSQEEVSMRSKVWGLMLDRFGHNCFFFAKLANIFKYFLVSAMLMQNCQDFSLLSPLLLPPLSSSRCTPAKGKVFFQDSVTTATGKSSSYVVLDSHDQKKAKNQFK